MTNSRAPTFPMQPADDDGPVFSDVWEAQAFAMVIALHEQGLFEWKEWAATLAAEIKAAQVAGDPDLGATYYHHWLKSLERMVVEKGLATRETISEVAHAWGKSARATPHGQPIVLLRH